MSFQETPDVRQDNQTAGCEDRRTREVQAIEAPCPLCGEMQEYFSDELTKDTLRCYSCKERFETAVFKRSAGL